MKNLKKSDMLRAGVIITLMLVSNVALAATDETGAGICYVVGLLTGKWLFGFTILATLGAGSALLFGAEITDGLKKVATIITVVGIILGMSSILAAAFTAFASSSC